MALQIAKDTFVAVGGLGTQADAALTNGGGATKTAWEAGTPSNFIAANGGPITADTTITYTNSTTTFSKTGIGTGVTVGTLAFVSGTNITTGIYEVTGQTNDTVVMANIVASGDNTDSVVNVGGAISTLQRALDDNDAATQNRHIWYNVSSITITAPIDIDTFGGSSTTNVIVEGYNSTLTVEAQVTITTNSDISTLLNFALTGDIYGIFRNLILDANGAGNANQCVLSFGASDDRVIFENCLLENAVDIAAVTINGDFWSFLKCEIKESGGGIICGGTDCTFLTVIGCSIHDNSGEGIHAQQTFTNIIGSLIYDNAGDGINCSGSCIDPVIIGNTVHGNTGDGISALATSDNAFIMNNACVGNTSGFGFNLNGASPYKVSLGFNLSAGNSSGDIDAGTFATAGIGSNQDSAQAAADIFVSVTDGAEDFTPKTGSDLINNGLDAADTGNQDIGAIQEASGGGGGASILVHPGMTGGMRG